MCYADTMYVDESLDDSGTGGLAVDTCSRDLQVFLNIVLEDAIEEKADGSKERVGQVVRCGEGLHCQHR